MHRRLLGKKANKGGQHTIAVDSKSQYIYAWIPRHKIHDRTPPFTAEGHSEIKHILDVLKALVVCSTKEPGNNCCQIFKEEPMLCMDNH